MKTRFLAIALFFTTAAIAQDTVETKNLDEVLIYSNKFAERKKNLAQKIDVITSKQIAASNSQNTGDLLMNTGNVFVQKSQQGGSSPVIRGFEASRVLLVVDGIRMNNAIYRAGHLQNVITVDQNMLDRIEVLYGPSSTIFGSDALGGVIHMRTRNPQFSTGVKTAVNGSAFARYSSANQEKTGHFDINLGWKNFAWLQSFNYSDFDDMRMGDNYTDDYPDFGRRSFYIDRINGIDSVVKNEDDRVQKFSGYSQWDIMQKFMFKQSEKITHLLNLQYSNSTNVPRYDRLQDIKSGTLRYAEWYYGPQLRELAAYEMNAESAGFFNSIKTILSYQHIEESRHQREYRSYNRLDNRYENLNVIGFTADARKLFKQHELTTGVDAQWNDVKSEANRSDVNTGVQLPLDTRYPNGENKVNYYGVYAQHLFKSADKKWVLNDGLRLQYTGLHSTIEDNSFFPFFPFRDINQDNLALTGNIGLVVLPSSHFRLTAGLASGFRSPNVDDAAKIFESNTASKQLIVPNENIKPERTYTADLGFTTNFDRVRFEATGYYTWFRDAIALAPFRFNDQDSINYNGTMLAVFANQNVNKAYLYGANGSIRIALTQHFNLLSTLNYTYGRLQPQKGDKVPLDHIPPVYGKTSLSYNTAAWQLEAYALYNGWKDIEDYNPSGEDNAQYATPEGSPSWTTLNLKGSVVIKQFTLQAGIENILDRNYRHFASGFSAGGRNLILALRARF